MCQQCLSSMPSTSPTSFSHVRDKMFFFHVLIFAISLIPLKISKDVLYLLMSCLIFCCLLILFFDLLADVFHLGLLLSVHIISFLDEGKELSVIGVNRCFSVRWRFSRVLLLCFTSHFCSLRIRRLHVLLLLWIHQSFLRFVLPSSSCSAAQVFPPPRLLLLHACQWPSFQVPHIFDRFHGYVRWLGISACFHWCWLSVASCMFEKIVVPIFVVQSSFLFGPLESKMCSTWCVVTLQVKHVICLGTGTVASASFIK